MVTGHVVFPHHPAEPSVAEQNLGEVKIVIRAYKNI